MPSLSAQTLLQQAINQHIINQAMTPPTNATSTNPNAALQQALSALQPLLQPGIQPTFGLPFGQMFQAPPTVQPIQQLLQGFAPPYQTSPSTTVFVIPQPFSQPVAETQTSEAHHRHKNCCPGCLSEIQELKRLVDLIIRANSNTITPGLGANISPLLLQQATPPSNISTSSMSSESLSAAQRVLYNSPVFTPVSTTTSFNDKLHMPSTSQENQQVFLPPKPAVHQRVVSQPSHPSEWSPEVRETLVQIKQEYDEDVFPTSLEKHVEDISTSSRPSSHDNISNSSKYDPLWKSKRGKNTMEMIQSRLEPDPLNPSRYNVKDEVLVMLRQKSDDRLFIARRLANLLFTKQERRISNCHGRRHKRQLDPVRLDAIKRAIFSINPMTPGESVEEIWKQSCASIDMSSRSACRNVKQL